MSTSGTYKRKGRAIGLSFSKTDDNEFLFQAVKKKSEDEDRSMSKVIIRILRDYFDNVDQSFKDDVFERVDAVNASEGTDQSASQDSEADSDESHDLD